jgi:hypothetical protein
MKKTLILVALVCLSVITFAQQTQTANLKAIKVQKHVNMLLPGPKSVVDSLHYDGENVDAMGTNQAATYGAYALFPTSTTAAHHVAGNSISSVKIYIHGISNVISAAVKIFSDTGITTLATQPFTPIEGWNQVALTTPLLIPATDIYVGYEVTVTGGYPLGCDGSTTVIPNGNLFVINGQWHHLTDFSLSLTYTWNIRAMISGTSLSAPVALCTPESWNAGTVIVGNTSTSADFSLKNIGAGTLTVSGISGLSTPFTTNLVPDSVNLTAGQSIPFNFSYTPTTGGSTSQTAIINTNAGNISVALTGAGLVCTPVSILPWTEGFENATFPPTCWSIVDANADDTTWVIDDHNPYSGTHHVAYYYSMANSANDWLLTNGVSLNPGLYRISYYYRVKSAEYPESFTVAYGSSQNVAAMTNVVATRNGVVNETYVLGSDNFTIASAGTYFFGFHVTSDADEFALYLDDIAIDVSNGISEIAAEVVSVYPNPANNKLFITSNHIQTVEIFNLTGARVANYGNQNSINISGLAQGTYLVKVITDNKVTTQKINIVR